MSIEKEKSPLIIFVEDGVVQEVVNSNGYYLLDFDQIKCGDKVITREFADMCVEHGACDMDDIEEYIEEDE